MAGQETAREQEEQILNNLLRDTLAGNVRWGFQPPSTIQANRGKIHYVLRVRRGRETIYKLTARRDGSKTVTFAIERAQSEADHLSQIFDLATRK
jgi:hypothetical protein